MFLLKSVLCVPWPFPEMIDEEWCDIFQILKPGRGRGARPVQFNCNQHNSYIHKTFNLWWEQTVQSQAVLDCVALDWDSEEHVKHFELKKKGPGLFFNGIVLAKIKIRCRNLRWGDVSQGGFRDCCSDLLELWFSAHLLQFVIASNWSSSVRGRPSFGSRSWGGDLPLYSKCSCCGGLLCVYCRFLVSTWTNGNWIRS